MLSRELAAGHVGNLRHEDADDAGQERQHDDRRVARKHRESAHVDGKVEAFA